MVVPNKKPINGLQKKTFVIFGLLLLLKCIITAVINIGKKFTTENKIIYNEAFDFC